MSQQRIVPLPNPDGIKARLSTLTAEELNGLKSIYRDHWRQNWLQSNGWLNVILGLLTIWLGRSGTAPMSAPKLIQTTIGLLIVGESIWGILAPTNAAILRFAGVLLIAGVWNLLIATVRGFGGAGFLVGLLGLLQIIWTWQTYKIYRFYKQADDGKPTEEMIEFYDEIRNAITADAFKSDPTAIRLTIGRTNWQALLLEDMVVYGVKGKNLLAVQRKAEANFTPPNARSMRRKRIAGHIKLNAVVERAMMQYDSFARYALWKGDPVMIANVPSAMRQQLQSQG